MIRISIIGTAGRGDDIRVLNRDIFHKCVEAVKKICINLKSNDMTFISGGSAWMDHIAVELYLQKYCSSKLRLELR